MIVEANITIYELNGEEFAVPIDKTLRVFSHGIKDAMVIIEINGQRATVVRSHLAAALDAVARVVR